MAAGPAVQTRGGSSADQEYADARLRVPRTPSLAPQIASICRCNERRVRRLRDVPLRCVPGPSTSSLRRYGVDAQNGSLDEEPGIARPRSFVGWDERRVYAVFYTVARCSKSAHTQRSAMRERS